MNKLAIAEIMKWYLISPCAKSQRNMEVFFCLRNDEHAILNNGDDRHDHACHLHNVCYGPGTGPSAHKNLLCGGCLSP